MESRLWLACLGLLATTILDAEAATFSNTSTPVSFYSSTYGPSIAAYSFTWSQYIKPTIIGTVEIIINTDSNRTLTTTKTKTEFMNNGTLSVLTRTDTNAAGTVTAVKTDIFGNNFTAAYPTPALQLYSQMTWDAMLPLSTNDTVCCGWTTTYSPTPAHTPFASPTPQAVDSADPSGWLYTLRGFDYGDPYLELDDGNISSLWTGQTIGISYTGCSHTKCYQTTTTVAAAVAVSAQAFLFATSTITTSGLDTSAAAKISPATSSPPSVVVDPITAGPSPTTSSSPDVGNAPVVSSSATTKTSTKKITLPTTPNSQPGAVETAPTILPQPATTSTVVPSAPAPVQSAPTILPQPVTISSSSTTRVTSAASGVDTAPTILPQSDTPIPPPSTSGSTTISAIPATARIESSQTALVVPVSSQTKPADIGGAIISIIQSGNAGTTSGGGVAVQPQNNSPAPPPTTTNALSVLVEAQSSIAIANDNGGQSPGSQARPTSTAAPQPVVIGSVTVTADSSSNFVVQGQTLQPGSTVVIGSGSSATTVVLSTGSSQTIIQVGTSVATIVAPTALAVSDTPPAIVVGGNTITADSSSQFVVSGQTLAPGSTITLGSGASTTVIALLTGSSQTVLQIGTSFSTIPMSSPLAPAPTTLPPLTIGSAIVTPNSASAYVIGSQTLQPGGPAVTVSSTVFSLASGATALVIDGTTSQILASASGGVGGYVWSGLGGSAVTSTSEVLSGSASGVVTWSQGSVSGSGTVSAAQTSLSSGANSFKVEVGWAYMALLTALVGFLAG